MSLENREINTELGVLTVPVYVCDYSGDITIASDPGEDWVHVESIKKTNRQTPSTYGDFSSAENALQYGLDQVAGKDKLNIGDLINEAAKIDIVPGGILTPPTNT